MDPSVQHGVKHGAAVQLEPGFTLGNGGAPTRGQVRAGPAKLQTTACWCFGHVNVKYREVHFGHLCMYTYRCKRTESQW